MCIPLGQVAGSLWMFILWPGKKENGKARSKINNIRPSLFTPQFNEWIRRKRKSVQLCAIVSGNGIIEFSQKMNFGCIRWSITASWHPRHASSRDPGRSLEPGRSRELGRSVTARVVARGSRALLFALAGKVCKRKGEGKLFNFKQKTPISPQLNASFPPSHIPMSQSLDFVSSCPCLQKPWAER